MGKPHLSINNKLAASGTHDGQENCNKLRVVRGAMLWGRLVSRRAEHNPGLPAFLHQVLEHHAPQRITLRLFLVVVSSARQSL
jgi:hypothetical protein